MGGERLLGKRISRLDPESIRRMATLSLCAIVSWIVGRLTGRPPDVYRIAIHHCGEIEQRAFLFGCI